MPDPLTLLLFSATSLGVVAGIDILLRSWADDWRAARSAFSSDVADSRSRLATVVGEVSRDDALTRGMDWGMDNTVTQALSARLRRGDIDSLAVYDASCATLVEARAPGVASSECPSSAIARPGRFLWSRRGGDMTLTLSQSFEHDKGGRLVLVGTVTFDGAWWELRPKTRGAAARADAGIEPWRATTRGTLAVEGTMPDGSNALALVSRHPVIRVLPRAVLYPSSEATRERALWGALCVVFAAAAWTWYRERVRRRALSACGRAYLEWAGSLVPGGTSSRSAFNHDQPGAFFIDAQELVSRALQSRIDAHRALNERRVALEQRVDALKREIAQQDRRIGELAQLDSLSLQMHRLTGAFLGRVKNAQQISDESVVLLRDGVGVSMDDLGRFVYQWQAGMRERGVRKFLRGLSETPGQADGQSQLDEHIAFLRSTASHAGQQTVKATMMSRRFSEELQAMARIARLWRGLALSGTEDDDVETTVGRALTDARGLFEMDVGPDARPRVAALPQLPIEFETRVIQVPASPLVAALYHILLCVHEHIDASAIKDDEGVEIVATVKPGEDGRSLLVFSLLGAPSTLSGFGRGSRLKHWNLQVADHLLTPYGMSVVVLPRIGDATPVAVVWQDGDTMSVEDGSELASESSETTLPVVE